ncbi:MAG: alpha-amylase family protein [Leptolyngbyaceae cyanobacterium]
MNFQTAKRRQSAQFLALALSVLAGGAWLWHRPTQADLSLAEEAAVLDTAAVTVHLFEWTWSDIARECETVLGPQGYLAVQISPPQEHVVAPEFGFPWWQRYQPVSYQLVSRSGDRAQLIDMVQRCQAAGVKIYADAVINHMAAIDSAPGSAGTKFIRYEYPGLYQSEDFSTCRQPITDYQSFEQVTRCELVSLPDLDTVSPRVQAQLADYLADLINLGISGLRIDAAKHIPNDDLASILEQLRDRVDIEPFIYQEVIDPGTEAVRKQDYYALGDVVEFEYGRLVGEAFLNIGDRALAELHSSLSAADLVPSHQAVVFIDNHDKQRGHGGGGHYVTYHHGELHTLALVFMLAYPYGKPRVMSSYAFESSEQGPPATTEGQTRTVYAPDTLGCGQEWICEHRHPSVTAMIDFRAATQTVPEITNWWSNGDNQIAFGRGDRGFIVINREAAPLTRRFQTQLPAGRYCEIIGAEASANGDCNQVVTVDEAGQFVATVEPMAAIALHQDAVINR